MGSKAINLFKLQKAGFNVPQLIVMPSVGVSKEDILSIVEEKFSNTALFAVRSSAMVEDGTSKSYAGHFFSAIAVKKDKLFEAYQKVVQSFQGNEGNVIVQQFITSSNSGVLFTNEGSGLMAVNSNFGLCKTVVEGEACDEWYISREGKVLRKHIAINKKPLYFRNGELLYEESSRESLSQHQISLLISEAIKIEKLFGSPQDIEWCFLKDSLYILQSRPITRYSSQNNWIFYDSANIAESYSGVVLPLTHSFAVNIYRKVYENLLIASGASRKRIARNQQVFRNMVSNFYGRMYYNMNNWYLMMSFMPGYRRNKSNLESMLTMNIRVDVPRSVLPSFWLKVGYPFIVIYKLIAFKKTINQFERKVKSTISQYRRQNIESFSANECIELYDLLTKELLEKFHIPVENDFLMMTYLGILRKKYSEEELKHLIAFENVSSRQVESITELAKSIFAIPDLAKAIETKDGILFKSKLLEYADVYKKFDKYFELYGGRFANELKLESADIEFETDALFNLLNAYNNISDVTTNKSRANKPKGFVLKKFVTYAQKREELRLLRSNCFSLVRRIFRRLGDILSEHNVIENPKDVFYLTIDDTISATSDLNSIDYKQQIQTIKKEYESFKKITPPSFFTITEGGKPIIENFEASTVNQLYGRSCTAGSLKGRVRVFNEFFLPETVDFDIMVARNTDPGWAALIGLSKGIIVENGGILSHAAIVSRELGIPTIIGVSNVTQILKTGQLIEMNGATGEIRVIE